MRVLARCRVFVSVWAHQSDMENDALLEKRDNKKSIGSPMLLFQWTTWAHLSLLLCLDAIHHSDASRAYSCTARTFMKRHFSAHFVDWSALYSRRMHAFVNNINTYKHHTRINILQSGWYLTIPAKPNLIWPNQTADRKKRAQSASGFIASHSYFIPFFKIVDSIVHRFLKAIFLVYGAKYDCIRSLWPNVENITS